MMAGELPQTLLDFIHRCIPTYQAAEVLLFFAAHHDRDFSAEEIVVAMRPVIITVPAAREYLAVFTARQLISESNGRFRYGPTSLQLEHGIGELVHAYNEKPVTLIRAIYRIADSNIQSFADSFKFRKD
jgi:hypothetical protein